MLHNMKLNGSRKGVMEQNKLFAETPPATLLRAIPGAIAMLASMLYDTVDVFWLVALSRHLCCRCHFASLVIMSFAVSDLVGVGSMPSLPLNMESITMIVLTTYLPPQLYNFCRWFHTGILFLFASNILTLLGAKGELAKRFNLTSYMQPSYHFVY